MNKYLYIFVEGDEDLIFFENKVVKDYFLNSFISIKCIPYANEPKKNIKRLIQAFKSRSYLKYLFVADLDAHPCVTKRVDNLLIKYPYLEKERILVIIKEIECWYLAGLPEKFITKFKFKFRKHNEKITKEDFEEKIPSSYTKLEFLIESAHNFDLELGKSTNRSIDYLFKDTTLSKIS